MRLECLDIFRHGAPHLMLRTYWTFVGIMVNATINCQIAGFHNYLKSPTADSEEGKIRKELAGLARKRIM